VIPIICKYPILVKPNRATMQYATDFSPHHILDQVTQALDDARYWHENDVFSIDERAVRIHYRLVVTSRPSRAQMPTGARRFWRSRGASGSARTVHDDQTDRSFIFVTQSSGVDRGVHRQAGRPRASFGYVIGRSGRSGHRTSASARTQRGADSAYVDAVPRLEVIEIAEGQIRQVSAVVEHETGRE